MSHVDQTQADVQLVPGRGRSNWAWWRCCCCCCCRRCCCFCLSSTSLGLWVVVVVVLVLVYAVFVAVAASPVFTSLYGNALLSSLFRLESRAQLAFLFFLSGCCCCCCCCTVKRKFYIHVRCCFVKVFMEAVGFYGNKKLKAATPQ